MGYDNPNGMYRIFDPATNKIISTKDWIISENEFWDFGEGTPHTSSVPNVETVMLHPPMHTQTQAHPITPERTQSPTVGTITPQSERSDDSEHLSPALSPLAPASPERSVEAEIQVLPIPWAPAIPTPPPPPLPEDNEDQGPRKSGRQMKARDFWEGGFAAFLAMMAIAEALVHYKDMLNRKDRRKWERAMDVEYKFIIKNKTWKLIARSTGANVIDSRWTYKLKHGGLHKA